LISEMDPAKPVNGVLEIIDKKGLLNIRYNFQKGYLMKECGYGFGRFRSKAGYGKKINDIIEYDYSSGLGVRHWIQYRCNGDLIFNTICHKGVNGKWYEYPTDQTMDEDISKRRKIQVP
jgi:hypothetical protein